MRVKLRAPPAALIALAVVALCAVLAGGALFCAVNWGDIEALSRRGVMFTWQVHASPFYAQTVHELILVVMVLIMGVAGLALIYEGAHRPRERSAASTIMLVGLILLLFSLATIWWLSIHLFG